MVQIALRINPGPIRIGMSQQQRQAIASATNANASGDSQALKAAAANLFAAGLMSPSEYRAALDEIKRQEAAVVKPSPPEPPDDVTASRGLCVVGEMYNPALVDCDVSALQCPAGQHPEIVNLTSTSGMGAGGELRRMPTCVDDTPGSTPPPSNEPQICNCLDSAFSTIASSLQGIESAIRGTTQSACSNIDDCIGEIIDKITEHFTIPLASCEQCKLMAEQGLAGTLEYAVQCAGACVEESAKSCSAGSPETWGRPCDTCGEPCCICGQGTCSPTDCPETKPEDTAKKFIAWCSPETGSIAVTEVGASPPGVGFYQVGMASDEQAAAQIATENCKKIETRREPVTPIMPVTASGTLCRLADYYDGRALERMDAAQIAQNMVAGVSQTANALLNFGFEGVNVGVIEQVIYGFARSFFGLPGFAIDKMLPVLAASLGCESKQWQDGMTLLNAIESTAKYTGANVSSFTDQLQYSLNAGCRRKFLDPDKAIAAFLANSITAPDLDAHWAIAGLCNSSLNEYLRAVRSKPLPIELASMRFRKLITDKQYADSMREIGFLEPEVAERLFETRKQLPPMSDIIRFMIRDADDETDGGPVRKFDLDALFDAKYAKQLREWGDSQGLPEKVARYAWRSHWTIPPPTQLFDFWHRLRTNPDYPDLKSDIDTALIQQDILPFWHKHYYAVSFRPIGRIDIRRAYNIGALSDDELIPSYVQLGYSDETSEQLAKFSRRLRNDSATGHRAIKLWLKFAIDRDKAKQRMVDGGLPDDVAEKALADSEILFASSPPAAAFARGALPLDGLISALGDIGVTREGIGKIATVLAWKKGNHPAIKRYAIGAMERDDASREMTNDGLQPPIIEHLLSSADDEIDSAFIVVCQRGIKRRYLMGELTKQEATDELLRRGTTLQRANRLAEWWNCEKSSTGKAVTASRLCNWLAIGAITATEFNDRLVKIGYTAADAAMMTTDCLTAISAKRLSDAKKMAKEESAAEEKAVRAQRRMAATVQRESSRLIRMNKQAQKTRQNRERQLMSAAEKYAKKSDGGVYDAVGVVKAERDRLSGDYGFTVDESLQTILLAVESWRPDGQESFPAIVTALAELSLSESNGTAPV